MITTEQQTIARQEAENIVREYLDHRDDNELKESIYEAIIEALKHTTKTQPVSQLFGVYSPENELKAVHRTQEGAKDNEQKHEKQSGYGFYVDFVVIHP